MSTSKILVAGIVGGIVALVIGFLTYGIALESFFQANMGSASGVMKSQEQLQWIPLILGHIAMGLLFAVIYGRWANISTFSTGAKAGAVIGFLVGAAFGLINFATTNIANLTATLVDIVISAIMSAIVGGIVALMLGRK